MADAENDYDESFISGISPLFSLSRLKKKQHSNITLSSSPSVSTIGVGDEESAYHVLPWRLFFNTSPSTPQQNIIKVTGEKSTASPSSESATAASSSMNVATTFNDKSPSTPRDVNQSEISMYANNSFSPSSSPSTKPRLFTPTSASKLLSNIYSHGSSGLRRKKTLDTTTTAYSDLTTTAYVDSPSTTNVQTEEPFSYHNLFLTQYQQLKTYQHHQSINRQLNHHSLDQDHSSYNASIENINMLLYSLLHMLLILTISIFIIGLVFIIMYSYLTDDYAVYGNISSSIISTLIIKPITIIMSIITSIASQNINALTNNLFSIYPINFPFTTTSSSSPSSLVSSVLSSSDILCTIKINMISRTK